MGPLAVMDDTVDAFVARVPYYPPIAIHGEGNLHITGEGNLTINSSEIGILSESFLRIDTRGRLAVSALDTGILSFGDLSIVNAADVQVAAVFTGIYSESDILIESSKVLSYGLVYGIATNNPNSFRVVNVNDGDSIMMFGDVANGSGNITIKNSDVIAYCDSSNGSAAIYAGDYISDPDADGHAQLSIIDSVIDYPQNARIVDTAFLSSNNTVMRCQTITTLPSIDLITSWDQAVKYVEISRGTVTISFDANGGAGDMLSPIQVSVGGTTTVPEPTFERSGYVFGSWNTMADESGETYVPGETIMVDGSFVLYAQWIRLFNVEFVDWSGSVLSTQQVRQGDSAEAPDVPERAGYTFVGWDADISSVQSDMTVNAVYSADASVTPEQTPSDDIGGVPQTGESGDNIIIALTLILLATSMMCVVIVLRKRSIV